MGEVEQSDSIMIVYMVHIVFQKKKLSLQSSAISPARFGIGFLIKKTSSRSVPGGRCHLGFGETEK